MLTLGPREGPACGPEGVDPGSEEEQPRSAQGRPCRAHSSSGLKTKDSPGSRVLLHARDTVGRLQGEATWAGGAVLPGPATSPGYRESSANANNLT